MTDPLDTMLDTLRTDVPEMSDRAFEAGRARVQAVVDPIPVATTLEPEPVVVALPKRRPLRSPPRRLVRLVASAAAVVALTIGVVAVQSGGDQAPVASAAVALNQAANNITATDPPVGPGQYLYTATHDWTIWAADLSNGPLFSMLAERLLEQWVPHDENQEWLLRDAPTGRHTWLQGSEEEAAAGGVWFNPSAPPTEFRGPCGDFSADDEGREPCSFEPSWERPTREFLDSQPRDPSALLERLRVDGYGSDALGVVRNASSVLSTGQVRADLRAAIYRALALVPELEITEELANLDDRVGMAFGATGDGLRQDLIVDTATGQFIGERMVTTEDGEHGPAGTVIHYSAVATAVVDEIGVPPAE